MAREAPLHEAGTGCQPESAPNSLGQLSQVNVQAYITSHKSEGWVCSPRRYDDGGSSGSDLDRPAVSELMKDIEAGEIDCVVVHRTDRLSRSQSDLAYILRTFEACGVSFVSVTEAK